uniref:Uncharacterized protein n=1 Tax=Timema tahoe TaxID=61484 RepID=A0A7R9FI61_9NEOP|nr:unnamed protein product [Timema tahoe]
MKTRSTSRLTSQHEKEIPRAHRASDSFLRAGPRTRSASHKLPTFQKSTSESSDLVSEKVVKNTFKTPEKDGITPERDGILPSFSDTEKLSQTTTITHKQTEENSQSLKDYGTLPDNSVLGFTKPDYRVPSGYSENNVEDHFRVPNRLDCMKQVISTIPMALQNTSNSPKDVVNDLQSIMPEPSTKHLLGSDISDEDISLKASRPNKLFKGRKAKTLVNKDLFREALQNTSNSPNDVVNDLQSIIPEPSTKHLSGSDISDEDISLKASRPKKLFKGRKAKKLVNKDLFREALQNTSNSPNDVVNDLQSIIPEPSTKHLSGSDISDEDISLKASRPKKLFKGRKAKKLVNKDLFREALQNTSNSPNDVVNDLQSIIPEPSTKHLSGSDISDEDISLKASRPKKLFKGRKAKKLVNKDLFREALQNTSNSPNDVVNDLQSIIPEPSTKHLSGSDISDEDISLKASRPKKLFKGRKAKKLVNKDLFREALQNTSNSPNDVVNDLQSIIPEPSTKHLSGSDISDEDISLKASRPNKLFKGRKAKTLVNKDLFQKVLQNTTNSPNDAINDLQSTSTMPEPSAKHLSGTDISDEEISFKAPRSNKLFKGRQVKRLVNKDLFQKALQNTTNSPNDAVTELLRKSDDTSAKHLSGSDISDDDISLKASRPTKLFKGRKAKTLVNIDLFREALQNTSNIPTDAINDLQSIIPEPSTKHFSGSDISDDDIPLKASRPNKLSKGRKAKTLVNKDLFREALQITSNSPNDSVNDQKSIIPEPSTEHLSGSDISEEDISIKASRPKKLFKGSMQGQSHLAWGLEGIGRRERHNQQPTPVSLKELVVHMVTYERPVTLTAVLTTTISTLLANLTTTVSALLAVLATIVFALYAVLTTTVSTLQNDLTTTVSTLQADLTTTVSAFLAVLATIVFALQAVLTISVKDFGKQLRHATSGTRWLNEDAVPGLRGEEVPTISGASPVVEGSSGEQSLGYSLRLRDDHLLSKYSMVFRPQELTLISLVKDLFSGKFTPISFNILRTPDRDSNPDILVISSNYIARAMFNTTFLPSQHRAYFGWLDYSVFGVMLALSALIGLYFAFFAKKKQNTTSEYLMGGKTMGVFPISMSLIARSDSDLLS